MFSLTVNFTFSTACQINTVHKKRPSCANFLLDAKVSGAFIIHCIFVLSTKLEEGREWNRRANFAWSLEFCFAFVFVCFFKERNEIFLGEAGARPATRPSCVSATACAPLESSRRRSSHFGLFPPLDRAGDKKDFPPGQLAPLSAVGCLPLPPRAHFAAGGTSPVALRLSGPLYSDRWGSPTHPPARQSRREKWNRVGRGGGGGEGGNQNF